MLPPLQLCFRTRCLSFVRSHVSPRVHQPRARQLVARHLAAVAPNRRVSIDLQHIPGRLSLTASDAPWLLRFRALFDAAHAFIGVGTRRLVRQHFPGVFSKFDLLDRRSVRCALASAAAFALAVGIAVCLPHERILPRLWLLFVYFVPVFSFAPPLHIRSHRLAASFSLCPQKLAHPSFRRWTVVATGSSVFGCRRRRQEQSCRGQWSSASRISRVQVTLRRQRDTRQPTPELASHYYPAPGSLLCISILRMTLIVRCEQGLSNHMTVKAPPRLLRSPEPLSLHGAKLFSALVQARVNSRGTSTG
jgi:hypothetical protein